MRKAILIVAALALLAGGIALVDRLLARPDEMPRHSVRRGPLVISLPLTGQVDAKRAHTITAPRIRNIQITWMEKEGSMVQAGDPVIRFDSTQQQQDLADQESQLKIAEASLQRAEQELAIQEKELGLELRQAERNYDEKKHEAPKVAAEAQLQLELAQLKANAALEQIRADLQKAQLEVQRARDKVGNARKELEQMTLTAPIPGMVVYLEIWKGSSMGKVQEGDSPWPGQGLINLPDLAEMIVKATVSEVDAAQVQVDQEVEVSLDAVPDTTFRGTVVRKGTLARRKDESSRVNVFDVEVAILDHDPRIKPGMSASTRVIVERVPDVLAIPLEAVFEVEGKPTVYLANQRSREVTPGRRNDRDIEIVSGLREGDTVLLVDPALASDEAAGDRATEPELNRGRTPPASRSSGEGTRGRNRGGR